MIEGQTQGLFATLYGINSVLQASGALTAGKIAKRESKLAQKQIGVEALAKEAERKEMLAKAMATANAKSGTSGILAFEGSPLSVLNQMEADVEVDTDRDRFISDLAKTTEKYRGRSKAAGYQSQAGQSLLTGATNLMASL